MKRKAEEEQLEQLQWEEKMEKMSQKQKDKLIKETTLQEYVKLTKDWNQTEPYQKLKEHEKTLIWNQMNIQFPLDKHPEEHIILRNIAERGEVPVVYRRTNPDKLIMYGKISENVVKTEDRLNPKTGKVVEHSLRKTRNPGKHQGTSYRWEAADSPEAKQRKKQAERAAQKKMEKEIAAHDESLRQSMKRR